MELQECDVGTNMLRRVHELRDSGCGVVPSADGCEVKSLKAVMAPLTSGKAFYFDPRGDLLLRVGNLITECVQEFYVCSRSVARWSPVLETMLFGDFMESKPANSDAQWTVLLYDDQVAPFFLVLSILHCHYDKVPEILAKTELYELLVVVDKYDMAEALQPWASGWFAKLDLADVTSVDGEEVVLAMAIAWGLGHEDTFRKSADNLLIRSRVDKTGQCVDNNNIPWKFRALEPPGILESITQEREKLLQRVVDYFQTTVYVALLCQQCKRGISLDGDINAPQKYRKALRPITSKQCDSLFLGIIIKNIYSIGLRQVALLDGTSYEYLGSLDDLLSSVKGLPPIKEVRGHENCDPWPNIQRDVKGILQHVSAPITEMHLQHLRAQAKKTGMQFN